MAIDKRHYSDRKCDYYRESGEPMNDTSYSNRRKNRTLIGISRCWELYLFLVPAIVLIFVFSYMPMYGILIAFKDYSPTLGTMGSPWTGLAHFARLITLPKMKDVIINTFYISAMSIILGFPFPVFLALVLNQLRSNGYKRVIQTVTYMPHFISTVVIVGMLTVFLSTKNGIYKYFCDVLEVEPVNLMGSKTVFRWLYVFSGIWQHTGWNAIIYLAALSGVDVQLYEAAAIDGANRFQRMMHIDIPSIVPTMIILLILDSGSVLSVGFEKIFLMQNSSNLTVSEVISTYTYKMGLQSMQFSFSTAVNLLNTLVNFVMLYIVNFIANKTSEYSLW